MALAISTDLTVIDDGDDTTNWVQITAGGSFSAEADFWVQRTGGSGAGCISRPVSGSATEKGMWYDLGLSNELDFSATGTEENMLVYMWIRCNTPKLIQTIANGGLAIRIGSSTSNYNEYYVGGSDYGIGDAEGWVMYVIDPSLTASNVGGTGLNLASARYFGATIETTGTAKGQNIGIDQIAYGRGVITATGTVTTSGQGFQEIATWDWGTTSRRYGMIIEKAGQFFCRCKFLIGSAGTASDFSSEGENLVWETPMYHNGTNRVKAIPDADEDDAWYYGIETTAGAGNVSIRLGALVGTDRGRSGPTFSVSANSEIASGSSRQEWRFLNAAGIEDIDLYGTTFVNCLRTATQTSTIDLSTCDTNDKVFSCNFDGCGRVDVGSASVRFTNFLNSAADTTNGALLWDNNTDVEDCTFVNPDFHSIVIKDSTGTPFQFTGLTFGTAALAVRYEDTEDITINTTKTTTGLTAEDASTGTTTFAPSVPIDITVVDQGASGILNARIGVFDAGDNSQYMNELTDSSGFATEPYTGSPPTSVVVRVRKNSTTDNPRYLPFNSPATISTDGLTLTVALSEDTNAN